MKTFYFEIDEDHNVILVAALFDGYSVRLLLDTGASNTVIDLTTVILNGYEHNDNVGKVQIETAKGLIEARVFKIKELSSLSIRKTNLEIIAYDFIGNGIVSEFDGVLGLDFFKGRKICIDFIKLEITID